MGLLTVLFYVDHAGELHVHTSMGVDSDSLKDFQNQATVCKTLSVEQGTDVNVAIARQLWQQLGNVPCDDDGFCEEPFLHFPEMVDREEIWGWFEDTFQMPVHGLMYSKGN